MPFLVTSLDVLQPSVVAAGTILAFIVPGAWAYGRDVRDAEIHILDAGHFALDEQADKVAQFTRDFLARRIGPPD